MDWRCNLPPADRWARLLAIAGTPTDIYIQQKLQII